MAVGTLALRFSLHAGAPVYIKSSAECHCCSSTGSESRPRTGPRGGADDKDQLREGGVDWTQTIKTNLREGGVDWTL